MIASKRRDESCTQTLANFAVATKFKDLPTDVIHNTKRVILDTLGCGIGGYTLDKGKIVAELARDLGGKPESTVLVTGDQVSCVNAAFANADLANALDADETFLNFTHFANTIVANALAVGERVGAAGQDLITAVAVGFDTTARIGLSIPVLELIGKRSNERIQWGPIHGYSFVAPGGAITAGKMLRLDEDKMAHALGLAGASAPCPSVAKLLLSVSSLSMQKYCHYGFLASTGVIAALLAEKGYTGDRTILDGDLGFWRFSGGVGFDRGLLMEDLGTKWWILEDSFKPYPCCRYTHGCLDLFYKIKEEQRLKAEEIESVTARLHSVAMGDKPLAKPSLTPEANDLTLQFNVRYLISMAALGFKPADWHSSERLTDPRLKDLMKKVKVEVEPESIKELMRVMIEERTKRFTRVPCSITVVARGKRFEARADHAKGDPWQVETSMSDEELEDKFRSLCNRILRSDKIERVIELVWELENLDNITTLTKLLTL